MRGVDPSCNGGERIRAQVVKGLAPSVFPHHDPIGVTIVAISAGVRTAIHAVQRAPRTVNVCNTPGRSQPIAVSDGVGFTPARCLQLPRLLPHGTVQRLEPVHSARHPPVERVACLPPCVVIVARAPWVYQPQRKPALGVLKASQAVQNTEVLTVRVVCVQAQCLRHRHRRRCRLPKDDALRQQRVWVARAVRCPNDPRAAKGRQPGLCPAGGVVKVPSQRVLEIPVGLELRQRDSKQKRGPRNLVRRHVRR